MLIKMYLITISGNEPLPESEYTHNKVIYIWTFDTEFQPILMKHAHISLSFELCRDKKSL